MSEGCREFRELTGERGIAGIEERRSEICTRVTGSKFIKATLEEQLLLRLTEAEKVPLVQNYPARWFPQRSELTASFLLCI